MIPNVLYKYVVPERIDVLLSRRIRFTQACFLNDPFEFRPGMPVPDAEGLGHFEVTVAKKREVAYLEKSRLFGVLSLTEKKDSIPMWAHYSATHSGFLIGFDTESNFFKKAKEDRKLQRVRYESERVSLTRGNPDAILLTKSKDWEFEQEWRWLECCNPYDYAEVVAAPNGELLFLRPLPPKSIREIVLGYRISPSLAASVQALMATPDYKHLKLFRVALNESQYKLQVKSL